MIDNYLTITGIPTDRVNKSISIDLGDEGKVHVTMENKELAQEVASGWTARSITCYEIMSACEQ